MSFFSFIGIIFILFVLARMLISVIPLFLPKQDLSKKYHNKYAVVTGGTDGIGLEIVKKLMRQGYSVYIVGFETGLIKQQDLLNLSELHFQDLADASTLEMLRLWISTYKPSILVHAAGICAPGCFHHNTDYVQYINAYITSMVDITSIYLRFRRENGGIVFFSSQVEFFSNPYAALYAGTKAFTAQFGRAIAIENPKLNVLVMAPGAVTGTSFFKQFPDYWFFKLIQFFGNSKETISDLVFRALGRITYIDVGLYTYATRAVVGILDNNIIDYAAKVAVKPLVHNFEEH